MKYGAFYVLVGLIASSLRAAESASPPAAATSTASHAVIPAGKHLGEKALVHRFERLRAGAIKTEKGWNVQDFASAFFNPSLEAITVSMKMVSDDPKFRFANGQVGTFTKTYQLRPMQGCTDNIYIGNPSLGKPNWPVAYGTNFKGSVEFTSSKPFYYYMLRETDIGQEPDLTKAYYAAWNPWSDDVPSAWDEGLKQFVVPYTNYWHNETAWVIGWQSLLTLKQRHGSACDIYRQACSDLRGTIRPEDFPDHSLQRASRASAVAGRREKEDAPSRLCLAGPPIT